MRSPSPPKGAQAQRRARAKMAAGSASRWVGAAAGRGAGNARPPLLLLLRGLRAPPARAPRRLLLLRAGLCAAGERAGAGRAGTGRWGASLSPRPCPFLQPARPSPHGGSSPSSPAGTKHAAAVASAAFHSSAARAKEDYYQVLGVPRTATQKEIKKAYYQVRRDRSAAPPLGQGTNPSPCSEPLRTRGGGTGEAQHMALGIASKAWSACAVIACLLPEGSRVAEKIRSSSCSS